MQAQFLQKTRKIFQQVTGGNTPILFTKRMLGNFLKIPPFNKILEFQDWKKDYKSATKKKMSKQKLNQWLKTYKMRLID